MYYRKITMETEYTINQIKLEIANILKQTNAMTSHFQYSTSPSSVAIFQHHQHMEFTFHNSYVILELVPSTVLLWTDLSCWRKRYSNKATLLLGWSHRYKNSRVVITIWLTIKKYPYLKWQWIFLHRCFFPRSLSILLPNLTIYE